MWVAAQFLLVVAIIGIGRFDVLVFSFGGQAATGWTLIALALLLGLGASLSLGGSNLTPFPKPKPEGHMTERGPYRMVRHPMYTAVILGMIGITIRSGDWVGLGLAVGLAPFFYAKSIFEERHLVERFPGYEAYRRRVPRRMIPGVL